MTDDAFHLADMTGPPRRRPRWPWLAAAGGFLLVGGLVATYLIAGGEGPGRPAATAGKPTATVDAAASTTRTRPDDEAGLRACQLMDILLKQTDMRDLASLTDIRDSAGRSPDTTLRLNGLLVYQFGELAIAARGFDDEFALALKLRTAGLNMVTACIKAGFPVGGP